MGGDDPRRGNKQLTSNKPIISLGELDGTETSEKEKKKIRIGKEEQICLTIELSVLIMAGKEVVPATQSSLVNNKSVTALDDKPL